MLNNARSRPLPEPVKPLIENFIDQARHLLQTEGHLQGIAFIGRGQDVHALPMNVMEDTKDEAAAHIHMVATTLEADFIFTIIEAWMLKETKLHQYEKIIEQYGSIADSPFAIECVMFQLETHAGTWSAYVPQKQHGLSKKKKTFGEVDFIVADGVQGRFSNLLPKPKGATLQ